MKLISFIFIVLITLSGCSSHPTLTPQYASMSSNSITIEAKDGSWEFSSTKPFTPPFMKDIAKVNPPKVVIVQRNMTLYNHANYKEHVKDVIVNVNGEKFEGKMLFSKVYKKAGSASAKRKWTVSVPETYLAIARTGNVAVLYQPYSYNKQDWASWVLWISKLPL
jgi:hypothetical protein